MLSIPFRTPLSFVRQTPTLEEQLTDLEIGLIERDMQLTDMEIGLIERDMQITDMEIDFIELEARVSALEEKEV